MCSDCLQKSACLAVRCCTARSLRGRRPVQAHLKADQYYSVVANMRGTSPEDVATKILSCEALRGLQVPSLAPHSPQSVLKKPRCTLRSWSCVLISPHSATALIITVILTRTWISC